MITYRPLEFTRSSGGAFASYWAADSGTESRYTIEEFGDGKNRYHLTYVDEGETTERGNSPVVQLGRFSSVTDAAYEARTHLEGVREDRSQRTVIEHPCMDGSLLSVFDNDYTRITEVIVNDEPGSGGQPHILQLTREQVIALQSALARVLDGTVAV